MKHMVALVGKQQIPNLLPAYFLKPRRLLLMYSQFTEDEFKRLKALLEENQIKVLGLKCQNEYEIVITAQELEETLVNQGLQGDVIFNLTGGTKAMVLAAYECAKKLEGEVAYMESGSGISTLYQYVFSDTGKMTLSQQSEIPSLLTIEQFLNAQLGIGSWRESGYSKDVGGIFEREVGLALQDVVDEMKAGVRFLGTEDGKREQADLDLVIRVQNQFGVIEVKDQSKAKLDAVKQLHYLSQLLGTYTRKFWVLSRETNPDHDAVIQATRTTVVSLSDFTGAQISEDGKKKLRAIVLSALG